MVYKESYAEPNPKFYINGDDSSTAYGDLSPKGTPAYKMENDDYSTNFWNQQKAEVSPPTKCLSPCGRQTAIPNRRQPVAFADKHISTVTAKRKLAFQLSSLGLRWLLAWPQYSCRE
jgi:hypothetical protein